MTHTHFQTIAEVVRNERVKVARQWPGSPQTRSAVETVLEDLAAAFADRLASTNEGFKRDTFLSACNPAAEYKPKRKQGPAASGYQVYADDPTEDGLDAE
jgi:hypothetical protein